MAKTNNPFWIVAGTRHEFENFVIRKRVMGCDYDFRYVASKDSIRGLSTIRGFYVGSYEKREDWPEISAYIQIIKSMGG